MALIHPRNDTTLPHALSTPSPPASPPATAPHIQDSNGGSTVHHKIHISDNDDDNEGWDDLDLRPLEHIFNRSPLSLSDSSSASDPGDYFQLPIHRYAPVQKQQLQLSQQQQQHQHHHHHHQYQHIHNKELPPMPAHRPRAAPARPLMSRAVSQPSSAAVATTFLPTPVTATPPSRLRPRPISSVSSSSASSSASASASASAPAAASSSTSSSATAFVEASSASAISLQDSLEAGPDQGKDRRPLPCPSPEATEATETAALAALAAVAPARSASTPAPAAPGSTRPPLQRQNSFKLPTYSGTITRIYAQHNKKEVVNDWADDIQMPSEGFHFSQVRAVLAARSSSSTYSSDDEALALMDEAMGDSHAASSSPAFSCPAVKNHTTHHAATNSKDIVPSTLAASSSPSSFSLSSSPPSPSSPLLPASPLRPRPQLTALTLANRDHLVIPAPLKSPTSLLACRPLSSPPASPSASISTSPALTTTAVYANGTLVGVASDAAQALKKSVSSSPSSPRPPPMETIETLDEDFDLSQDISPMELVLKWRRGLERNAPTVEGARWNSSPDSEVEEIDFGTPLDTNSRASSASLSRDATTTTTTSTGMAAASLVSEEENIMEGIEFPETMEGLQLVTERTRQASQILRDVKKKRSEEEFWDGIELGDENESLPLHRRNKHVVVRDGPSMAERRQSRVCREEVPLKDFVAAPSKIPRLTRPPGDYSRPVSPAPTLSRSHSTHLDLPLVKDATRSSLPRPTRGSMRSRTMDLRGYLALSMSDSTITSSAQSTPFASRAPTPTLARLSFQLQEHPAATTTSKDESSGVDNEPEKRDEKEPVFPVPGSVDQGIKLSRPAVHHTGRRALEGLRSLAGRFGPKISKRREIPSFDNKAALPPLPAVSSNASIGRAAASKLLTVDVMKRPSFSRSSSFTDWESELDLDDLPANHGFNGGGGCRRPSQEIGDGRLSCVSTMSEAKSVASSTMGMFPKRVFLRRGSKYDTFGDGSELERFDNLPTFERDDSPRWKDDPMQAFSPSPSLPPAPAPSSHVQSSAERVTAWLRKPTSTSNLRPPSASTPGAKPDAGRMPKSKSIRRSLFDIFGQNTEPTTKEPKKKKAKSGKGPTLIRNLSQADKPKDIDGMVYNPEHKMWDGNNDILEDFEDQESFFSFPAPPAVPAPTPIFPSFPQPLQQHQAPQRPSVCHSPSIWSASTITRPALISNMNHCSSGGPRPQMSGKMVFDPVSMSWRINPAYLALRRVKRRIKNPLDDASDLDDAWGDEPNVFAGLSDDSDKSDDEDDDAGDDASMDDDRNSNREEDEDHDPRRLAAAPAAASAGTTAEANGGRAESRASLMDDADDGMLSEVDEEDEPKSVLSKEGARRRGSGGRKSRYGSIRLQIPPGFASEDLSTIDKDDAIVQSLAMWSEQPLEPITATPATPTAANGISGGNFGSIRGFPLLRTVESKSSRKSLRACLAAANVASGGVPNGGGYSSRDEFEVGLEFDITDKFLEDCLAAEAQHRRDAGRFFALPCSPAVPPSVTAATAATPLTTIKARLTSSVRAPAINVDKKKTTLPKKIRQATLKGLFGDKTSKKDQLEIKSEQQEHPLQPDAQPPLPPQSQPPHAENPAAKKKSLMSLRAMVKGNKSPGATLALGETMVAKPLHRRLPLPEAFRKQKTTSPPAVNTATTTSTAGAKVESKEKPRLSRNSSEQQEEGPQTLRFSSESSDAAIPCLDSKGDRSEVPALSISKIKRSFTFGKKKGAAKAKTLGHAAALSMQQAEQQQQQKQQPQQTRDAQRGGKSLLSLFSNVNTSARTHNGGGDVHTGHNEYPTHRRASDSHYQTQVCNRRIASFDEKRKTMTMTTPQQLSYAATLAIVRRGTPYGAKASCDVSPPLLTAPSPRQSEQVQEQEQPQEQTVLTESITSSGSSSSSSVGVVDLKQLVMNGGSGHGGAGVGDGACTHAHRNHRGIGSHHLGMDDDDDQDDEAYESDQMERGYRVPSSTRGRPPPHRLADILWEFERATVAREQQQYYQQQLKKKMEQEQQRQQQQQQQAVVLPAKELS
ncbi:hypothetical protein BGZ73_007166 [Actinomortierella ambigua]|nr:hypothetical protein BGZ73_007166 [Actinomortierella ambigua]